MTVNNSLLTLANLTKIWDLSTNYILCEIKATAIWGLMTAPDVKEIWDVPLTNSRKAYHEEVSKGTAASRDADGNPTGLDFNDSDVYENLGSMENVNAKYTLKFQDKKILESEIDTLLLIHADYSNKVITDSELVSRMQVTQYGKIIQAKLSEAVKNECEARFLTFVKSWFTDNFFDTETPLKSAAGSLYPNINIVAAEFASTTVDSMINLSILEKTPSGAAIGKPIVAKHLIVDNTKYADALAIVHPNEYDETQKRSLMGAFGSGFDMIPMDLGNANVILLGAGHGCTCLMDSEEPIINIKEDSNANVVINVDISIGFVLKHGLRIFAWKK